MTDTKNPAATEHDRAVEAWDLAMRDLANQRPDGSLARSRTERLRIEGLPLMRRPAEPAAEASCKTCEWAKDIGPGASCSEHPEPAQAEWDESIKGPEQMRAFLEKHPNAKVEPAAEAKDAPLRAFMESARESHRLGNTDDAALYELCRRALEGGGNNG